MTAILLNIDEEKFHHRHKKDVLASWLAAIPQGCVTSPMVAADVAALGLGVVMQSSCSKKSKVNCVPYANDFFVTGADVQQAPILVNIVRDSLEAVVKSTCSKKPS